MATASLELLESLHADTALAFSKMVKEGVPFVIEETGEVIMVPMPSAMWSVIVKFIKDNDITGAIEGVKQSLIGADPELALPFAPKLVVNKK